VKFWDASAIVPLELAAAFVAAERRPPSLQVVTLDERLADTMRGEGFALVDIAAE
jgi:hypothetical protein